MPDEPLAVTPPPAAETPTPAQVEQKELAAELASAEKAAGEFLAAQRGELEAEPSRPRDEHGRFAAAPKEGAPAIDGVWQEAAKQAGFTDQDIAGFKSDEDAQARITSRNIERQVQAIQTLRLDPVQYTNYQRWLEQQGQQAGPQPAAPSAPAAPPPPPTPVEQEFKLAIDEDELTPELVKPFREMEKQFNQIKATLAQENRQLRDALEQVTGHLRQSAEMQQRAQLEARWAQEWDNAAKEIPGFVDVMGLPSEVRRAAQTNPQDPKALQYSAFAAYFQPVWERYVQALGPDNAARAFRRVLSDAYEASPFAKLNGRNGNPTTGTYGAGSVVRGTARRGATAETPDAGLEAELNRSAELMAAAWGRSGVNPFGSPV